MPRLSIIILEETDIPSQTFRYALWADVPAARQSFYANSTATSRWINATSADNSALQSGAVVERIDTIRRPAGATLPQMQADLQAIWTAYQAAITANNYWVRYGSTWDGTTWVMTGVS